MSEKNINELYSICVLRDIARVYRSSSTESNRIAHDLRHVIKAYELCDKEAALACNRYIVTKYPNIFKVAQRYGLRLMKEDEIYTRTSNELQHMLYCLCVYLYDCLKQQTTSCHSLCRER